MISKYPLKKHPNIKRDLRMAELTSWALKHGWGEPAIINQAMLKYQISETAARKYAKEVMERLRQIEKDHSPKEHYTPFDTRVNWRTAKELSEKQKEG